MKQGDSLGSLVLMRAEDVALESRSWVRVLALLLNPEGSASVPCPAAVVLCFVGLYLVGHEGPFGFQRLRVSMMS